MSAATTRQAASATTPDDEVDPYIQRIQATGCFALHEALQDCHYDTKDWRACKGPMRAFRECMERYASSSSSSSSPTAK
jgi:cytochrome c oxidase assembly factor 4